MTVRSRDTRWKLVGGLLFALWVAYVVSPWSDGPRQTRDGGTAGSSMGSSPHGCDALYRALADSGYAVRRFTEPWTRLPQRGVLVCLAPGIEPDGDERAKLEAWVRAGGTAILGVTAQDEAPLAEDPPWTSVDVPSQPGLLHGVARLEVPRSAVTFDLDRQVPRAFALSTAPLVDERTGAVVSCAALGDGLVVVVGPARIWSNDGIGRADNVRLLLNAVGAPDRPVLFDEYHHGYVSGEGLWAKMPPSARAGAVLLGVAGVLLGWALSRRLGAVVPDPAPVHERWEYVDAMAALLARASAVGLAAGAVRRRVRRRLARELGADPSGDLGALAAASGRPWGAQAESLLARLDQAPDARTVFQAAQDEQSLWKEMRKAP